MSLVSPRKLLRAAVVAGLAVGLATVSAFQGGQFPPLGTGISVDEKVALQALVDGLFTLPDRWPIGLPTSRFTSTRYAAH